MRRYIVLLLITGIVWAQTDFDKLVLKDGTEYLGEYSKIEEEIVYFKPQNAFGFQPIPVIKSKTIYLRISKSTHHQFYKQKIQQECVSSFSIRHYPTFLASYPNPF